MERSKVERFRFFFTLLDRFQLFPVSMVCKRDKAVTESPPSTAPPTLPPVVCGGGSEVSQGTGAWGLEAAWGCSFLMQCGSKQKRVLRGTAVVSVSGWRGFIVTRAER